jgi:RNA polymerase sigma-70 factor (ECF subfamily)
MSQDAISFQQLYDQYAKDVYRFSYWLSGDVAEAKDMTSEAFVRVWTATSEIRNESVKAYLFAIARNQYLHNKRRNKKFAPMDEAMQDTSLQHDQATEVRSDLEATLKALQTLPEIDRSVLLMRAQDELSYEEIARSTGLSVSAVKVKVFRARAKLNSILPSRRGGKS